LALALCPSVSLCASLAHRRARCRQDRAVCLYRRATRCRAPRRQGRGRGRARSADRGNLNTAPLCDWVSETDSNSWKTPRTSSSIIYCNPMTCFLNHRQNSQSVESSISNATVFKKHSGSGSGLCGRRGRARGRACTAAHGLINTESRCL
jgi:hypothetical protein